MQESSDFEIPDFLIPDFRLTTTPAVRASPPVQGATRLLQKLRDSFTGSMTAPATVLLRNNLGPVHPHVSF
jgi:hypothetical protein